MNKDYQVCTGNKYILLNSKSVLDSCDFEASHVLENIAIMDKLVPYAHCRCNVKIFSKIDFKSYHIECCLAQAINELPQQFDLMRGIDFKLNQEGDLIITCYGEEYDVGGIDDVVQVDIIISVNDNEVQHINFKEVLLQSKKIH
jgi:hypothetical protein